LREYFTSGEILGAAGNGRVSAATRQDYAAAAAAALLRDEGGNVTYELGGPSFDLAQLGRTISDVTNTRVTYRDLPQEQFVDVLQQGGLAEGTARFVPRLTRRSRVVSWRRTGTTWRNCSAVRRRRSSSSCALPTTP